MPDPLSLSVRAAAQEIAAGRLTAEDLATSCLDRIAAREGVIGAWEFDEPRVGDQFCELAAAPQSTFEDALARELEAELECFATPEFLANLRAFADRPRR